MKAKNILRISVFAALLCIMTIFSAFAAEPIDAKILRFDGKGTLPAHVTNVSKYDTCITSDGNFRILLKKTDLGSYSNGKFASSNVWPQLNYETYGDELDFKLSQYPYAKIKYRTNYIGKMQFYIAIPGKGSNIYYEKNNVGNTTAWQTTELYYGGTGKYNDNNLSFTPVEGYFPTSEQDINVGNNNKPFFQFKGVTEDQYKSVKDDETFFIEVEYVAFFKTEAEMNAYTGNDTTKDAKIIAWDGSQNVRFSILNSSPKAKEGDKIFSSDDGFLKIDMKADYLNDPDYYEPNNGKYWGHVCFQPFFENKNIFKLSDYPYVKVKLKTDYSSTIQFYNPGTNSRADFRDKINNHLGKTVTAEFNYNSEDSNYVTDGITWKITAFGDNSGNVGNLRFQFKDLKTGESGTTDPKCTKPVTTDLFAEIYYIAYFNNEADMLAYDTADLNAVNEAVEILLENGSETNFIYNKHPASTEADIVVYALTKAKELVGTDVDVSVAFNTAYKYYSNVLVTVTKGDVTKTIGINVRVKDLADITPTVKGAQIRTNGDVGLRFGFTYDNTLSKNGYDADSISYGTLLVPADLIGSNKITLDNVSKVLVDGKQIIANVPATIKYDETNQKAVIYTAVVTNIDVSEEAARKNVEIIAVPYVKYKVGETEYVAYGEQIKRSYSGILQDYTDDKGTWSTDTTESGNN